MASDVSPISVRSIHFKIKAEWRLHKNYRGYFATLNITKYGKVPNTGLNVHTRFVGIISWLNQFSFPDGVLEMWTKRSDYLYFSNVLF